MKQPLTPPRLKDFVAYHTSNHKLAIQSGEQLTIPKSRFQRLRWLHSDKAVANEAPFVTPPQLH
jgi:hypothetical protein